MVPDLIKLKSHPDKLLIDHITGVRDNIKMLTDSKVAELVAIFHDLGKINPNFQDKFDSDTDTDNHNYSHHSYFSSFAFFCTFCISPERQKMLKDFLSKDELSKNDIIALIVLIAKHHANIPNFTPEVSLGSGSNILSINEISDLFLFLNNNSNIPIDEYVAYFFAANRIFPFTSNIDFQKYFRDKMVFDGYKNQKPLDFFLDNQYAFASLIQADKADAGRMGNIIIQQQRDIQDFCSVFGMQLERHLLNLHQDSELNILRTKIRNEAVNNIQNHLIEYERIFELTAATGSGKTLMLLSLAAEIIKAKGPKRIIYALPFLSITEQVESEILKIFENQSNYIQRIDSKSENKRFEELQNELEKDVSDELLNEFDILNFKGNTFAYPLVITTFVRFFETLLSNRNSELLKLPNFSNCIFLIDEIQALPPRLYGFFVAYITKFCQKFNSYAIVSTATQPNYEIPKNNITVQKFFYDYIKPKPLLPLSYFNHELFNRYRIEYLTDFIDFDTLIEKIITENSSVLIILNTIDDTKELYKALKQNFCSEELLLLNTHFTARDRKLKIYLAKRRLRQNKKVIVISTQLIEAGVDIDFPVVYRDFSTVASIVQSAGRCNRNGKLPCFGKVVLIKLVRNGKIRSDIIYQGTEKDILTFTKQALTNSDYIENDLLNVQQEFFKNISEQLLFARYGKKLEDDFIKDITECMFEKIGRFQLIDKQMFGVEKQFYIPKNNNDSKFETLLSLQDELMDLLKKKSDISIISNQKNKMKHHLKKMSNQIVQIRIKKDQIPPRSELNYFELFKIDLNYYSFKDGIDLQGGESII